ncbi:protein YgfX [Halomonas elongata]|uniref:Protein YgfX n=1 Tax=Halomonas elongata (strain ATCC 33173 / DSM 2581 / NBRC 15536 / NCIMB 2198 / 1H9) TaxID=768066 RepID=E1V3S0_HALED|nr:protein YgfX [Halomonas elongata]WBF16479.1 hypothetical protein LM502_10275 [Halomonas elongata]WPU48921.1 protein YgfX [Halomonas elongata DSM 2581]CBV42749.1 uncharacterized protein HELO_2865 [Halomonas elongata DSM 2581]
MPRAPVTIPIAASRLSLGLHTGLGVGVVGVLGWWAPAWLAAVGALVVIGVLVRVAQCAPRGELRFTPRDDAPPHWSWRDGRHDEWRDIDLRCDYLGPWLIGLRVGRRRLWLWPDSADPARLRELRRALLSSG